MEKRPHAVVRELGSFFFLKKFLDKSGLGSYLCDLPSSSLLHQLGGNGASRGAWSAGGRRRSRAAWHLQDWSWESHSPPVWGPNSNPALNSETSDLVLFVFGREGSSKEVELRKPENALLRELFLKTFLVLWSLRARHCGHRDAARGSGQTHRHVSPMYRGSQERSASPACV